MKLIKWISRVFVCAALSTAHAGVIAAWDFNESDRIGDGNPSTNKGWSALTMGM